MKIINIKKSKKFAIFLIISGVGALWLTYWWFVSSKELNSFLSSKSIVLYFIFNSTLLLLLGILLLKKQFKIYSILAILLGVSVTISLLIFDTTEGFKLFNNLFFVTTFCGIVFGLMFGGIILVPVFLYGVYRSAISGLKYFRGDLVYQTPASLELIQPTENPINTNPKNKLRIIPIIGIVLGIIIQFLPFLLKPLELQNGNFQITNPIFNTAPIFLTFLSIISLINKKIKLVKNLNLIIGILSIYFIISYLLLFLIIYQPKDTIRISFRKEIPEFRLIELKGWLEEQESIESVEYIKNTSTETNPLPKIIIKFNNSEKGNKIVDIIFKNYHDYINSVSELE